MILDRDEIDPIQPVNIDHRVDEVWADDQRQTLDQRYNYLDYHFEKNGRYCRARAYLDEPGSVTLFGPFIARNSIERAPDVEFADQVAIYLKRRFRTLKTPGEGMKSPSSRRIRAGSAATEPPARALRVHHAAAARAQR